MRMFIFRIMSLLFGLSLFALGIVITIKANIGYAPWDVFHAGLAHTLGISIGLASIITGVVMIAIVTLAGEKIGLGTIANIVVIGLLIDLIIFLGFIPTGASLIYGIVTLLIGLFIVSIGSFFYIKSGFGAGPRDNLMVVLNKKTKLPVGICRSIVELSAILIGWLLGGMVGVGTVISAIAIGFFIQMTFAMFKFKVSEVKHETIVQTYKSLREISKK